MTKELQLPEGKGFQTSGIQIEYTKSRDVLYISGYFDNCVGIEGTEISFTEFCNRLGIDLKKKRWLSTTKEVIHG